MKKGRQRKIREAGLIEKLELIYSGWVLILKFFVVILLTTLIILGIISVFQAIHSKTLKISHFKVGGDLEAQGFTGEILAQMLLQNLDRIRHESESLRGYEPFLAEKVINPNFSHLTNIDFQIVGVSLSINSIIEDLLGRNRDLISGSITKDERKLTLDLRISNGNSIRIIQNLDNELLGSIDALLLNASLRILQKNDPYALAAYFFDRHEFHKSKEIGLQIVESGSIKQWGYFILGLSEAHLGNETIADSLYRLSFVFDTSFVYSKIGIEEFEFRQRRDTVRIRRFYQQLITQNPRDSYILSNFGYLLYHLGHDRQADSVFIITTQIRDRVDALIEWGIALKGFGYFSRSYSKFRDASFIDPMNAEVWFEWGRSLALEKRHNEAIQMFVRAIEIDPSYSLELKRIIASLINQNRIDETFFYFPKATELRPNDIVLWNRWGEFLYHKGQYNLALEKFNSGVQIDPKNGILLNNLKNTLIKLKRFNEATLIDQRIKTLDTPFVYIE